MPVRTHAIENVDVFWNYESEQDTLYVKKSRIYQINGFMVKPPRAAVLEKHIRQTLGL